ncbi:MAG: gliding motility-associated ABC transporter permease subunit GldF [Flavobacteriales bacterium]|nr:gliding motility-associated ABC transporter permease subunit GldF [Flavobacteriales bacterium]MCZ2442327.1 gliding motility-associated ABC transporter permease subunit GldF [Flavobacteriales bacterium]
MTALLRKEINLFFSSVTGYVVVILFLIVNSIFLWFIPGDNFLEWGYADLSQMFENAPYVFLLLIPAITMRSFADEKNYGTLESLITKPISETQIIIAKYLAALILVCFALLPTLIYYYTLYQLGNPIGNIDSAAVAGSYLGLILLASIYVAIGIFASSIADNQIVSLLIAFALCLIVSEGFQLLAGLSVFQRFNLLITNLGIRSHYVSISRGVIDTRDIIYFLSANVLFLLATKTMLQKRNW